MTAENKRIVFSRHALEHMAERSIAKAWAEQTLRNPEFERQDARETGEVRAFRRIDEAGGRWLRRPSPAGRRDFRHHGLSGPQGGEGAMKVKYDPEADAVFLRLAEDDIVDSEEMQPGMIVDFDADGKIVAIEFLNAKERFSPDTIQQFSAAA